MADLFDLTIETPFGESAEDKSTTYRKAATLCMPGLINDTLANKAVDINEAIRGYWLVRIAKMSDAEVAAMLRKYAPLEPEAEKCIKKLEN